MKAHPGDRIVVAPVTVEGSLREGKVLEARGPEGSPPFLVEWSDGHTGLLYPGPGSVLRIGETAPPDTSAPGVHHPEAPTPPAPGQEPAAPGQAPAAPDEAPADTPRHVRDWEVRISVFGSDDATDAHVVLLADSPTHLTASGHSQRGLRDPATPEIGDEVAVARALRRLADQLLETAAVDIEQLTGEHDVTLRPT